MADAPNTRGPVRITALRERLRNGGIAVATRYLQEISAIQK